MQDIEQMIVDLTAKQELIRSTIALLRQYAAFDKGLAVSISITGATTDATPAKAALSANCQKKVDWTPEKRAEQSRRMKLRWRKVNREKAKAAKKR